MTVDEIFARIKDEVAGFSAKSKLGLTPRLWPLQEATFRGTFVFANPEAQRRKIALPEDYAQKFSARPRGEVVATVGIVRLSSYVTGTVYIDSVRVDKISAGDVKQYFNVRVGNRKIEVRASDETVSGTVAVQKGRTATITLRSTKPAEVVSKQPDLTPSRPSPRYPLRSMPDENFSENEVKNMLQKHDFYSTDAYDWSKAWANPNGRGIQHEYRVQKNGQVVYDAATGLYWQQAGSADYMNFESAQKYIEQLRRDKFAGFDDWRLPTLEEAMSLMSPGENKDGLYIDAKFDKTQSWIWTADKSGASRAWVAYFSTGLCTLTHVAPNYYVRAVR